MKDLMDDPTYSTELDDPGRYDLTVLDVLAGTDDGTRYTLPHSTKPGVRHRHSDLAWQLAAGHISADDVCHLGLIEPAVTPTASDDERDEQLLAAARKLDDEQATSTVAGAVAQLDELEREVTTMHFGLSGSPAASLRSIAAVMSTPLEDVYAIRDRAMAKLRTILAEQLL